MHSVMSVAPLVVLSKTRCQNGFLFHRNRGERSRVLSPLLQGIADIFGHAGGLFRRPGMREDHVLMAPVRGQRGSGGGGFGSGSSHQSCGHGNERNTQPKRLPEDASHVELPSAELSHTVGLSL